MSPRVYLLALSLNETTFMLAATVFDIYAQTFLCSLLPLQDNPGTPRGAGGFHLSDHRLSGGERPGQLLLLCGERQRAAAGKHSTRQKR